MESSFISHAQVSPSQPDDQQIYCKEIHFSLSTDARTLGRFGLTITNSGVIALLAHLNKCERCSETVVCSKKAHLSPIS